MPGNWGKVLKELAASIVGFEVRAGRQVAGELARKSDGRIALRWYDTHGEQFHTKLVVVTTQDTVTIFGGSANLTRRNIGDYNLEADLKIVAPGASDLVTQVAHYYERIWNNADGHYTVPLDVYVSGSVFKRIVYRIQEFTGFCTY